MFIMGEKSMMGYIFNRMELKRNIFSQASQGSSKLLGFKDSLAAFKVW